MAAKTDMDRIDATDFTVLFAVQQHDAPPWKNKIHGWIANNEPQIPISGGVSVQTVGRRVDDLVDDDMLETVIVSPEDIKRDLIIAFRLTENGQNAITEKRESLLKEAVRHWMFNDDTDVRIGKEAIITLLLHKFGWEGDLRSELDTHYTAEELATFLTMIYIDEEATDLLDSEVTRFQDIIARYNDMADALMNEVEDDQSISP